MTTRDERKPDVILRSDHTGSRLEGRTIIDETDWFLTVMPKNTDPPRGIVAAGPVYSSITRSKRAFPPRNAVRAELSGVLVPRAPSKEGMGLSLSRL
jgi:hypothetical protein